MSTRPKSGIEPLTKQNKRIRKGKACGAGKARSCWNRGSGQWATAPSDQLRCCVRGMEAIRPASRSHAFDAATIGALAHLYRGEVYRSTIWRTRLDNTTNWAVVILGIALSVTFSSREAPFMSAVAM